MSLHSGLPSFKPLLPPSLTPQHTTIEPRLECRLKHSEIIANITGTHHTACWRVEHTVLLRGWVELDRTDVTKSTDVVRRGESSRWGRLLEVDTTLGTVGLTGPSLQLKWAVQYSEGMFHA